MDRLTHGPRLQAHNDQLDHWAYGQVGSRLKTQAHATLFFTCLARGVPLDNPRVYKKIVDKLNWLHLFESSQAIKYGQLIHECSWISQSDGSGFLAMLRVLFFMQIMLIKTLLDNQIFLGLDRSLRDRSLQM